MKTYSRLKIVWLFPLSIMLSMADAAFGHEANSVFFDHFVDQEINYTDSLAKINAVSDLADIQQLESAVQSLQRRTDNLEAHYTATAQQQFSTTTKLQGEVIFAIAGVDGDQNDSNLSFGNRVRLNLDTSFTGKDRLRTRLQGINIPAIDDAAKTDMARLAFQGNSENELEINVIEYRFPVGDQAVVYLEAVGGDLDEFVATTLNPYFSGSGSGSLSRFAQRNPIYRQGEGVGLGLVYNFTEKVSLSLGYIANDANDPEIGFGETAYGAIAQLTFEPRNNFKIGLTYVRSYNNLETGTGSRRANDPFNGESNAINADSFGLQSTIALQPHLALSGWIGYTNATASDLPNKPAANIFNWAVTLAMPDLGTQGSVVGIAIGQPPKTTSNVFEVAGQPYKDENTSLHLEAFYRYQVDDNIAITPGLLVITNPEHNRNQDTIYVGTIRTTFRF